MPLGALRNLIYLVLLPGCGIGLFTEKPFDTTVSGTQTAIEAVGKAIADGTAVSLRVTLRNEAGNPLAGLTPLLEVTGFRNTLSQNCSASNSQGESTCLQALGTEVAEAKTIRITGVAGSEKNVVFDPKPRGHNLRACGLDLNRNGVIGEAADCHLCDGSTTDPDGDGQAEDLIYVDAVAGNDGTGTGSPAQPYKTLAAAMAAADGPGDGAEDILCIHGTFNEAVTFARDGLATSYTVDSYQFPRDPFMIVAWDKDADGVYAPLDEDDEAVIDGQNALPLAFLMNGRVSIEVAHVTVKRFRDPAAAGGGFLRMNGAGNTRIYLHDLEVTQINDGLADNNLALGRCSFYWNTSDVSHVQITNSLFDRNGGNFWIHWNSAYGAVHHFKLDHLTGLVNAAGNNTEMMEIRGYDQFQITNSYFKTDLSVGWDLTSAYTDYYSFVDSYGCTTGLTVKNNEFIDFARVLYMAFLSTECIPATRSDEIVFDSNRVTVPFGETSAIVVGNALAGGGTDSVNHSIEDVRVTNNFIVQTGLPGDECFWSYAGNSTGANPGTIIFAANTCVGPLRHQPFAISDWTNGNGPIGFPVQNYRVLNNLFDTKVSTAYALSSDFSLAGWIADGNVFHSPSAGWRWGGAFPATLGAWQGATGQDAASVLCSPAYADAAGGDYHLSASDSCARGAGVDVTAYAPLDIDGDPRPAGGADIGADQFTSP